MPFSLQIDRKDLPSLISAQIFSAISGL